MTFDQRKSWKGKHTHIHLAHPLHVEWIGRCVNDVAQSVLLRDNPIVSKNRFRSYSLAGNAAKKDLGAEMGFHAVECTSGNLTVARSMVPVVPPDTSANLGMNFVGIAACPVAVFAVQKVIA
jgi:hypothetical protein